MKFDFDDNPNSLVMGRSSGGKSAQIMHAAQEALNNPTSKIVVYDGSKKGADE